MMLTTYYFLAGASGKRDFWQPVMQRLKSSNLIMHQIDYPSFAGCPAHSNVNSFTDLSDYVFNQIQHPSVIIAQSMGGLFAIRAALEKPNVQALVLVATSGGIDLTPFNIQDWREAYLNTYLDVPHWFTETDVNYQDQLKNIHIPVLLIWANDDAISPLTVGQALQRYLPHAELKVITAKDHHFAFTQPRIIAKWIEEFLLKHAVISDLDK